MTPCLPVYLSCFFARPAASAGVSGGVSGNGVGRLAIAVAVLAAGVLHGAGRASAATFTAEHGDIGVAYDSATAPTEFEMELHVGQGGVVDGTTISDADGQAYEPDEIAIGVPAAANLRRINNPTGVWGGTADGYDFTGSSYDGMGVAAGGNLWVLSFDGTDADHYGTPFLGWATEEGFAGENFTTGVTFSVSSFAGPSGGTMGVYTALGSNQWLLSDGDTDFSGDAFTIGTDAHVHRVLMFSEPGSYLVGINASATHATHGLVSGSAVYEFSVVPEPSGLALAGMGLAAVGVAVRSAGRRRRG